MTVKGNAKASSELKGKICAISEISIPTKIDDLPTKCDHIKGKIKPYKGVMR